MKFLTEKTITSKNYNLSIMMIDMPKAFDKVNRKTLFEKLEAILDESEMRMMYLLINNFKVKVRVGRSLSEEILTNIGIAQGECFSTFFFIFYWAKFVDVIPGLKVLWSELDWLIDRVSHQVVIDPKSADDISFIRTDET